MYSLKIFSVCTKVYKIWPNSGSVIFTVAAADVMCVCVCVCVCVFVSQLCLAFCKSMDCSLPGSSVHRLLQTRILEWVAIPFFRRSAWSRDWAWVSSIEGRFFTIWATREADVSLHQLNPPGFSSLICKLCLLYLSCLFSDKTVSLDFQSSLPLTLCQIARGLASNVWSHRKATLGLLRATFTFLVNNFLIPIWTQEVICVHISYFTNLQEP